MKVKIIGKLKSKAKRTIIKEAKIDEYRGQKSTDVIINYGLAGENIKKFFRRYPNAVKVPIINKYVGCSKYKAIIDAEKVGVIVPKTVIKLPIMSKKNDWIEKRIHSSQGIGIIKARGKNKIPGKYYQKMVQNRYFELRVHAFKWIDKSNWLIQKRIGPEDKIAWNFHQGGRFYTIKHPNSYDVFKTAKNIAEKILNVRKMMFGAVDFIVTKDLKIYFIEINSAPGFTELSKNNYIESMSKLKSIQKSKFNLYI